MGDAMFISIILATLWRVQTRIHDELHTKISDMIVLSPSLDNSQPAALAAGAAVAGLLLYYVMRRRDEVDTFKGVKLRKLNTPKDTLPIIGDSYVYVQHQGRIREWAIDQCLEFKGEPWLRRILGQPDMITFSSPEAMEEITTTQFENFEKGEFQIDIISSLFGRGIVASDGERWYHQRKTAVKFFSARTLRAFMAESMTKNLTQVCGVLDDAMATGQQVDLKQLFHEFTLQTFVEMGLGVQLNWIGSKEPHPFQTSIDAASPLIITRFRTPAWFWKTTRWLNIGTEAQITKHMDVVYAWLRDLIGQSLAASSSKDKGDEGSTKSVVELFIQHSDEDQDGLRAEDLADFLLTFVVAARDTTASTLAWLFYAISKHPEVINKIRDEITECFPTMAGRRDAVLTSEHTKQLIYLEATIRETLRLYPAAPSTVKQVVRDTIVCGDILLRKGQICILHALAMARNPRVWGPNAAEFKPERWIDTNGQIRHFPASKFFTFHAGPRACIGMSLAMLELRVVTANLLNRYQFAVDPVNDGSFSPGPILIMKHQLLASVTRA